MVLLVMIALGLLGSLALADAIATSRAAEMVAESVRARAEAHRAVAAAFAPPDLALLCLQPPSAEMVREVTNADGGSGRVEWRTVARGRVVVTVTGYARDSVRHRLILRLKPDTLPSEPWVPGCPAATRLEWEGGPSWIRHPEG